MLAGIDPTMVVFLKRLPTRRGVEYLVTMNALRRYLLDISDAQFEREAALIPDERSFGYLISAGLSSERQAILAKLKGGK